MVAISPPAKPWTKLGVCQWCNIYQNIHEQCEICYRCYDDGLDDKPEEENGMSQIKEHDSSKSYAIVRETGGYNYQFTKWHTLKEAQDEAERLTKKEMASFLILKCVGKVEPAVAPVKITMFKDKKEK